MRVIVIGYGVQGHKRHIIAGDECVAIVDPINPDADYKSIYDVNLDDFDAALVSTPDSEKYQLLCYLLKNAKHVMVEKPLLFEDTSQLLELENLAREHSVTCYTAYNHRFEPHFIRMKNTIKDGLLGRVYSARMFYGNGTARLVRDSLWRDQGSGVLPDLGSHLLDTFQYWLGQPNKQFKIITANNFENKSPDLCSFVSDGSIVMHGEVSLLSWRNHFYADVYGENGSAHIQSLCKWGPSVFTLRNRVLPSGKPEEDVTTITQDDPTWEAEYKHFKELCSSSTSNIANDIWINDSLTRMANAISKSKDTS